MIEIGFCIADVQRRECIAGESLLVRPPHSRVSTYCTQLTTLTQAQGDQGLPIADAYQQ
jgi:inhibitor of KinA sporulation pathway (predicted exonuclease)